jgi:hypothetical protein
MRHPLYRNQDEVGMKPPLAAAGAQIHAHRDFPLRFDSLQGETATERNIDAEQHRYFVRRLPCVE